MKPHQISALIAFEHGSIKNFAESAGLERHVVQYAIGGQRRNDDAENAIFDAVTSALSKLSGANPETLFPVQRDS